MKIAISIFSVLGIIGAAILFIFLSTSTINAPALHPVPEPKPFGKLPLNEAQSIEFEIDEETFDQLTQRERRDQMLDWLLYIVVSDAGLSVEEINQSLFDIPAIRYGYMHPIANFEYGETRSIYIGDGKVVALVPANGSADQRHDHLAHIADEHRKNLGEIPSKLLIFEYQLDPDAPFAQLIQRQEFDTQKLYTRDSGYYEAEIQGLDDLKRFMNQIDDITFAQVEGNSLRLGGRKIRSHEYRGIQVEDIATIWQAEKKIHEQWEEFNAFWSRKQEEFFARWKEKIKDFDNSYGSSKANILVEAINRINSLEKKVLLTIPIDELIRMALPPDFRSDGSLTSTLKQYIQEYIALLQQMIDDRINRRLVQGSGFSLDPTYDYDGLMNFFEEIEPQLRQLASEDASPITMQDIEEAKNALAKHAEIRYPEVPFLKLADKLAKSEDQSLGWMLLFSVEDGQTVEQIVSELNRGRIPDELRTAFRGNGFPFSEEALVAQQGDNKWLITSDGERFIIRLEDRTLNIYGWISKVIEKYRFQAARYDGDLQGTEVGMVLFYTDLLAKLWRFDYAGSAPSPQIEDFKTHLNVSVSPIYQREIEDMPATRLWFGPENMGFQVAEDSNNLLFARNATRIYAASHDPLNPGAEVTANALSSASLEWWDHHYEEVAHYEQKYEQLNEIMKWSLVISWLNAKNKGHLLGFWEVAPVKRSNWFPEWVRRHPELKFQKWDEVGFYPRGYKGTRTEAMPILRTREFHLFGTGGHFVSGGVSLAPKSLFEEREPLSKGINGLLRRSNIDYGSPGIGNQNLRTYEGIEYILRNLASNQASVVSRVNKGTKLRARYAELAHSEFERIISQEPLSLNVETHAGGNHLGTLEIARTAKGFKASWRSQEIAVGQSLARRLSKSKNPDKLLLEDPAVEAMFKLIDEGSYLVKMRGMDRWVKIAPEEEPSPEIPPGWQSRVADTEGAIRNLLLTWVDEGAVRAELARQRYIIIESVGGTDKIIWEASSLHVPPEGSKELLLEIKSGKITIQGQLDENGALYLSWDTFSEILPNEDHWIGLQKLLGIADLEQIRKIAPDTQTAQYVIPEGFIDNTRFIHELKAALAHRDYFKVAQDIVNAPQEFRLRLAQYLAEELKRNDRFLANGHIVKAIQHLNDLITIYGLRPELAWQKRIAEALLANARARGKLFAWGEAETSGLSLKVGDSVLVASSRGLLPLSEKVQLILDQYRTKLKDQDYNPAKVELAREQWQTLLDELFASLLDRVEYQVTWQEERPKIDLRLAEGEYFFLDVPVDPGLRGVLWMTLKGNPITWVGESSDSLRAKEALMRAVVDLNKPITVIISCPTNAWEIEANRKVWKQEVEKLRARIKELGLPIEIVDLSDRPGDEAVAEVQRRLQQGEAQVLGFFHVPEANALEVGLGGRLDKEKIKAAGPSAVEESFKAIVGCSPLLHGLNDVFIESKLTTLTLTIGEESHPGKIWPLIERWAELRAQGKKEATIQELFPDSEWGKMGRAEPSPEHNALG